MPAPEIASRFQDAVLWPAVGTDAYGRVRVGAPVPIRVRFEETFSEAVDRMGNTVTIDGTATVDRDIAIGSVVWFGAYNSLPVGNKVPGSGILEVKTFSKVPDVKGRQFHRQVGLMRLTDTVPT